MEHFTYILGFPCDKLLCASEALWHDKVFEIHLEGEKTWVRALDFTPEKWKKVGVGPIIWKKTLISARAWEIQSCEARGFLAGIRFMQGFMEMLRTETVVPLWKG